MKYFFLYLLFRGFYWSYHEKIDSIVSILLNTPVLYMRRIWRFGATLASLQIVRLFNRHGQWSYFYSFLVDTCLDIIYLRLPFFEILVRIICCVILFIAAFYATVYCLVMPVAYLCMIITELISFGTFVFIFIEVPRTIQKACLNYEYYSYHSKKQFWYYENIACNIWRKLDSRIIEFIKAYIYKPLAFLFHFLPKSFFYTRRLLLKWKDLNRRHTHYFPFFLVFMGHFFAIVIYNPFVLCGYFLPYSAILYKIVLGYIYVLFYVTPCFTMNLHYHEPFRKDMFATFTKNEYRAYMFIRTICQLAYYFGCLVYNAFYIFPDHYHTAYCLGLEPVLEPLLNPILYLC